MNNKKTIIDVRTPGEFNTGHVPESLNIPLQEIFQRVKEIKKMQQPIVLCCASGNRSGQAAAFLQSEGVDCENGGCWFDVNFMLNEN